MNVTTFIAKLSVSAKNTIKELATIFEGRRG
jgi:hypothetical protein